MREVRGKLKELLLKCLEHLGRLEERIEEREKEEKKEGEEMKKKIEEINKEIDALKEGQRAIFKEQKEIFQLLEKLTYRPGFQKGFALCLDWPNFRIFLKDSGFLFPEEIVGYFEQLLKKPLIFAFAFCEGFLKKEERMMLERAGFLSIFCSEADEAIINTLEKLLFPNERIDEVFLITNDQILQRRARRVSSFFPDVELISLFYQGNLIKDRDGKYHFKLSKRKEKIFFEEINPFMSIVERIKKERLLTPLKDPYELFFLIVVRVLPEIRTKVYQRGFYNLVSTIWETYFYSNPKIQGHRLLREIATKENLKLALEAIVEEGELLERKEDFATNKVFYVVNTKSELWKKCVSFFGLIGVERYIQ